MVVSFRRPAINGGPKRQSPVNGARTTNRGNNASPPLHLRTAGSRYCPVDRDQRSRVLVHVVVAAVAGFLAAVLVVLGLLGDEGVAGEEKRGDGGGVGQSRAGDLGGVDDAGF